jgi:hypothetical protein
MIIIFFDVRHIVRQTVNQEFYNSLLRHMREALRRHCPDLWASGQWTLLHDNARPHTAQNVNRFLTKHVTVLQQPHPWPLSMWLFLFPQLKKALKSRQHENIEAIQAAATMELTVVLKEAFTSYCQDLLKRWQQYIDCGGNCFEGDRNH